MFRCYVHPQRMMIKDPNKKKTKEKRRNNLIEQREIDSIHFKSILDLKSNLAKKNRAP